MGTRSEEEEPEADYLSAYSAELKQGAVPTAVPPICLHAVHNFTFIFLVALIYIYITV